jgi:outer membrane protein assembly factor BamB
VPIGDAAGVGGPGIGNFVRGGVPGQRRPHGRQLERGLDDDPDQAVHGDLYVRDSSFSAVLKASNGKLRAPFSSSGPPPAVDLTQIYDLEGKTLTASSLSSGSGKWTFTGDGTLDSAPLVAGSTVLIGGSSGNLYALSSATGTTEWTVNVGSAIPAPGQ